MGRSHINSKHPCLPLIPFIYSERAVSPFQEHTPANTCSILREVTGNIPRKLLWGWKLCPRYLRTEESEVGTDFSWSYYVLTKLSLETVDLFLLSLFSLTACPLSGAEFVSLKDQPSMWFPQPCSGCFSLPFPT